MSEELTKKYADVQAMFEICSNGTELKEFCINAGVNYNDFKKWQRCQLWDGKLGRSIEKKDSMMSPVEILDAPVKCSEADLKMNNEVSFIQFKFSNGLFVKQYNTTVEDVMVLLDKLTSASCYVCQHHTIITYSMERLICETALLVCRKT